MDKTLFADLVESMQQHNEIIADTRLWTPVKSAEGRCADGFITGSDCLVD
jgi:hypothetical protein